MRASLRHGFLAVLASFASVIAGCGTYGSDLSGGGVALGPGGASVARPKMTISFTADGQVSNTVQTYAALAAETGGGSAAAGGRDHESAVRRVLFPTIVRGEPLDVVFVVDTTGSMGWALGAVKSELHTVVETLAQTNPDTRFGFVGYRDVSDTDTYVTRLGYALDSDRRPAHAAIDWFNSKGGGDFPEHVYAGLDHAMRGAGTWRPNASHHIVLIGDAPAHDDYADGRNRGSIITEARRNKIRIHTVAIACAFVCKKELGL